MTALGYGRRELPAPAPNPETRTFWDAAREGRFLLKWCTRCDLPHWYPRAICPFCFCDETVWRESPGKGTIYTYSVMRRVPQPYVIAYVTLEEGVTMLTNIVDCDVDALSIGMPVRLLFVPTAGDGPPMPAFTPDAAGSADAAGSPVPGAVGSPAPA
jgi:uncharacterized OB-fold protein